MNVVAHGISKNASLQQDETNLQESSNTPQKDKDDHATTDSEKWPYQNTQQFS